MKQATNPHTPEAVGKRLILTRRALGFEKQKEFAERAGIAASAYNQWETGTKFPGVRSALLLCNEYGLTLDWIYRGDPSGLPYHVAKLLTKDET
jgi:transcriptional regulator with XRE-family HTH domain